MLHLFNEELYRLWRKGKLAPRNPELAELSPRLRQVLDELLRGQSEKEVAAALGLSRHTVTDYVKELHRRFGVHSRGELLARFIRV